MPVLTAAAVERPHWRTIVPEFHRTSRRRPAMRSRWIVVALLLSLVLGASPVSAAITPIDPANPPPPVLGPAELAKLAALRTTMVPQLSSAVSPDDRTVVTFAFPDGESSAPPQWAFLDVVAGSSRPIDPLALAWQPILPDLAWRDGDTAAYLSAGEATGP